jgi:carbamoyl-phosphate synthase large subunit
MKKVISPVKVMIAGVGGASLGTELCKSLKRAEIYEVFGCDISPSAYGLHDDAFSKTYLLNRENYIDHVIESCHDSGANWLIPGGEQPMVLLGAAADRLSEAGIHLVANNPAVIDLFSDKDLTFKRLEEVGVTIPRTVALQKAADVEYVGLPCIVKPATGSGGSVSVFFAVTVDEAMIYAEFISRSGSLPIAQEYVGDEEGEFTIGVLSLPNEKIVGSIALRRELNAKLSVAYRGRGGIVSSGYSQGYIDEFPDLCRQAELIARAVGSRGPINIQARVRNGQILPFEINPRFSASTYLRALAGFNEVDILLRYLHSGEVVEKSGIRPGWYLRSLTEQFVPREDAG